MWGAIKNDLLDFVTTITDDTTRTLNKVLGEEDDEEGDITMQEKLVADLRRSFETYDSPIREADHADYKKFRNKFSLSSVGGDIAQVLDQEPEVSRFYAELVPLKLTAEEFWARLFFRVHQIYKSGGAPSLEEDDEEELTWDEDEEEAEPVAAPAPAPQHTIATAPQHQAQSSGDHSPAVWTGAAVDVCDAGTLTIAPQLNSSFSQTTTTTTSNNSTNTTPASSEQKAQQTDSTAATAKTDAAASKNDALVTQLQQQLESLSGENKKLLAERVVLYQRIDELEAALADQRQELERVNADLAIAAAAAAEARDKATAGTPSPPLTDAAGSGDQQEQEQSGKSSRRRAAKATSSAGAGAGGAQDYQSILSEHSEESNVIVDKKGATLSAETEKYLAALDDPEDEEDGWD